MEVKEKVNFIEEKVNKEKTRRAIKLLEPILVSMIEGLQVFKANLSKLSEILGEDNGNTDRTRNEENN